jgi:alpha-glucosidase
LTVAAQQSDPASMLSLYRSALRERALIGDAPLSWLPAPASVLAFSRGPSFACAVNLSTVSIELPPGDVLLASAPLSDGHLPPDTAAWLRRR